MTEMANRVGLETHTISEKGADFKMRMRVLFENGKPEKVFIVVWNHDSHENVISYDILKVDEENYELKNLQFDEFNLTKFSIDFAERMKRFEKYGPRDRTLDEKVEEEKKVN